MNPTIPIESYHGTHKDCQFVNLESYSPAWTPCYGLGLFSSLSSHGRRQQSIMMRTMFGTQSIFIWCRSGRMGTAQLAWNSKSESAAVSAATDSPRWQLSWQHITSNKAPQQAMKIKWPCLTSMDGPPLHFLSLLSAPLESPKLVKSRCLL